jgi:hypothetical protein
VTIEGKAAATQAKATTSRKRTVPDDQQVPEEFRRFFKDFGGGSGEMPFGGDADNTPHLGFGSGFLVDPPRCSSPCRTAASSPRRTSRPTR